MVTYHIKTGDTSAYFAATVLIPTKKLVYFNKHWRTSGAEGPPRSLQQQMLLDLKRYTQDATATWEDQSCISN